MPPTIELMEARYVEALARMRLAAFFDGTGRTLEEDIADLNRLSAGDSFEAAFVARDGDAAIGTCLLVRNELEPAHELTPWLAGLVVDAGYRGRGIGTALVRAVEARAMLLGVDVLYLYTWEARDFYARLGWTRVETFEQDSGPMLLMSRKLRL